MNTLPGTVPEDGDVDELTTVSALDEFVAAWGWTGHRSHDQAELEAVRELRLLLRSWWTLEQAALVATLNELLLRARAVPQLVDHDGWGWHVHSTPPDAPLATRIAVDSAMAFVELLRAGELDRLGLCAAPDCDDVLVDLSKNRSRRYCEGSCGNRAAVAAYRQRHRPSRRS